MSSTAHQSNTQTSRYAPRKTINSLQQDRHQDEIRDASNKAELFNSKTAQLRQHLESPQANGNVRDSDLRIQLERTRTGLKKVASTITSLNRSVWQDEPRHPCEEELLGQYASALADFEAVEHLFLQQKPQYRPSNNRPGYKPGYKTLFTEMLAEKIYAGPEKFEGNPTQEMIDDRNARLLQFEAFVRGLTYHIGHGAVCGKRGASTYRPRQRGLKSWERKLGLCFRASLALCLLIGVLWIFCVVVSWLWSSLISFWL
ncbi:hypothetical protein BJ508DRAFT_31196 [Ascobolus immersus RN42]|uniref:Uncharacterized protein n=1 Tax=Ascobolus immersus RN42 TaxID=1160509 RepID=A0A3N4IEF2_ASCIM|nr:hypothetical protein BJ508DRAFT_31196 [Ascobolus immersus RN42]